MKVILSRKGFDSENGGIASPIFEDGTMISLPIPSSGDTFSFDDLIYDGKTYREIIDDLGYKQGVYDCHFDPQLDIGNLIYDLDAQAQAEKTDFWRPSFGQVSSSAGYLLNNGIEPGDLFLFFGTFHHVEKVHSHFQYVKHTGDFYKDKDLHVIWGYMQVGEIAKMYDDLYKFWWHPHSTCNYDKDEWDDSWLNVIFASTDKLSFDENKPGAGVLPFSKKRVLTLEGESKAMWKKNPIYDLNHIIGNRKNSTRKAGAIYYAGIWQELMLKESKSCENWAKKIILG